MRTHRVTVENFDLLIDKWYERRDAVLPWSAEQMRAVIKIEELEAYRREVFGPKEADDGVD